MEAIKILLLRVFTEFAQQMLKKHYIQLHKTVSFILLHEKFYKNYSE